MKKLLFLVTAAVAGVSVFADDWVYDPEGSIDYLGWSGGTISDGTWVFKATVKGTDLTVDSVATNVYPETATALDFSKPIHLLNDESTTYCIVKLDPKFGYWARGNPDWGHYPYKPINEKVGALTLPGEGLTEISEDAFLSCPNAEGSLVFPDTVLRIYGNAFAQCTKLSADLTGQLENVTDLGSAFQGLTQIVGDVYLKSVRSLSGSAFKQTGITSVRIGPTDVSLDGNYQSGTFFGCTSLTNAVFEAGGTASIRGDTFEKCTSLTCVDFSGLKSMRPDGNGNYFGTFGSCSKLTKIVFSSALESLDVGGAFEGASKLQEVHYYGMAPVFRAPVYKSTVGSKVLISYVHLDENDPDYAAQKASWDALTDTGSIADSGSCWKSDMIDVATVYRPLILYKERQKGEVGYWVFSGGKVRGGDWEFDATSQGDLITLTTCTKWPEGLGEVDFTKRLTDADGIEYFFGELSTFVAHTTWEWSGGPKVVDGDVPEANAHLGSLILPTNGLHTIGVSAFANCINLTNIENCFPDSVLNVGAQAFFNCPFPAGQGDLKLRGMGSLEKNAFTGSKATSVEFGKSLTTIRSNWGAGAFESCSELTNVVFSPESRVTVFDASQDFGPFRNCKKLVGDNGMMDIRALTALPIFCLFGDCPLVTGLTCGPDLTSIKAKFFNAAYGKIANLKKVRFLGPPPADAKDLTNLFTYYAKDHELVCEIPLKYRKEWGEFCEQGKVQNKKTYWKSQYVGGDDYKNVRLLICPDAPPPGLMMIVK